MIEFVQRYWLEVLFGGIVSGLSFAVRHIWAKLQAEQKARQAKEEQETAEQAALKEAVLALLHDRLYSLSRFYIDRGWITIQDLDNLEYLYTAYHALGGNGTGTELFMRCKALPIRALPIAPITEKED